MRLKKKKCHEKVKEINHKYIPNKLLLDQPKNDLPLLKIFIEGKKLLFMYVNKVCKLPTESVKESIND